MNRLLAGQAAHRNRGRFVSGTLIDLPSGVYMFAVDEPTLARCLPRLEPSQFYLEVLVAQRLQT